LPQDFFQHTFPSGLTLLGEKMSAVQSAAMTLMLPAGSAYDPENLSGSATVLSELVLRGAGSRDSRQLTDYLDSLGLQRAASVSTHHTRFSCAAVADRVMDSLAAYSDIVLRPRLPAKDFKPARELALQSLKGLEDDPRQKLLVELRKQFLPDPLGRNPMGRAADLKKLNLQSCQHHWKRLFHSRGAILAFAGNIDFARIKDETQKHFGDLTPAPTEKFDLIQPTHRAHHLKQKSEQTHIGIAYNAPPETDPDYYVLRAIMEVFGGGMSSRLFTEVREKRALCYSVWAGYTGINPLGAILIYAGSSNDRAQATLDCILSEINRLSDGITQPELDRAKIGLKAGTILQGESTSARCGAIAHDWFTRGRLRTLTEIDKEIDAISLDRANGYLRSHTRGPFTIVTVGPKPLKNHQ
jgi:predicted Zn-dependent peptidase